MTDGGTEGQRQTSININQYLFSELQYKIMLKNKYVHRTSTNDI